MAISGTIGFHSQVVVFNLFSPWESERWSTYLSSQVSLSEKRDLCVYSSFIENTWFCVWCRPPFSPFPRNAGWRRRSAIKKNTAWRINEDASPPSLMEEDWTWGPLTTTPIPLLRTNFCIFSSYSLGTLAMQSQWRSRMASNHGTTSHRHVSSSVSNICWRCLSLSFVIVICHCPLLVWVAIVILLWSSYWTVTNYSLIQVSQLLWYS